MKTSSFFTTRFGNFFRHGILLAVLAAGLPSAALAQSVGAFVEPLQFITVDTRVDSSVGTIKSGITYVLGRDDSANAFLRKFDASGAAAVFDNGSNQVTIAGITPTAMAVVPGSTNLYIVGGSKIYRVSTENGQILNSLDGGSGLSLQSVFWGGSQVEVCGNFSGGTRSVFGWTATVRGSQAGIIIKLSAALSSTALGLLTYGNNGGSSINTADSIVVDDNGDIYVSGHLDTGTFNSDVFNSGAFNVMYRHNTAGINNLSDAQSVVNGNYTSSASSTDANMCNIGTSSDNGDHNYIWRETGIFNAPSAGQYTFTSSTDDGSWLYVDGNLIIYDNTSHATQAHSGTMSLFAGLHSVDWLYWNGGGPGNGSLTWGLTGSTLSCMTAADFSLQQNKGYIFKFSSDLASLKNAYFTSYLASGVGGEVNELAYSQGFVYGVGHWKGAADNPAISPVDNSNAGSADVDILKLDTGLQLKARATVKGVAENTGFSITVDEAGNAYLTGSHGPQSADFFGNGDPTNQPFTSISSAKPNIFIAQLDSNFTFQWVNTPSTPLPDFNFPTKPRVRWNTVLQRVFWMGYFNTGSLIMGNPNAMQTLNGPEGFIAVLDPNGKFTERVNLTIASDFGVSGTQIKPFGGPGAGSNTVVVGVNTRPVIKGAQVIASVPNYLYRNQTGDDITSLTQANPTKIDTDAETRITCTGYSVGDNVANGVANSYTFTITKDTIVRFNWTVEHALRIKSDFSETEGHDPGSVGHIVGLKSDAAGSPLPTVQKHWILENEPVIATVDAAVDDQDYLSRGLAVRYVVTGYDAFGPPNTLGDPGTTNFIPFVGSDARRQVSQFLMSSNASITYHWKLKIGVQIATTGLKSTTFPLVHVTANPGQVLTNLQADGMGSGTFFFDEGTSVQIGTIRNQDVTQLKGWFNGDGTIFPSTGSLTNLVGSFNATVGGVTQNYASLDVANLNRPARVMWDYGDRIFDETVFIGNSVTFSTVDDPAVRAKLRTDLEPAQVVINNSPQGSTATDMAMWDSVGKKYYPLRPGQILSYWYTTADPADRVIIRLTFQYPVVPHYRHIANTKPVALDPSTNDLVSFVGLKYTEPTTGAAVDSANNFSASGPGRTVLLFSETSSQGRGGTIVTPRVRVVQTMNWNDNLPATQPAIIGKKITSSFDTAGLGTGFLYYTNARYDAAIYDRNNVAGQIIPVNLNPTAGANEQLVVVWYENRDKILWPYQAVRYQPAWPSTPDQGLHRIVIASRYGNESVAADGTDQFVVPEETYGTNTYPAETSFNPARFQQVQIYNQPNRALPGYNPNEEHALLAPSLRSAAISPQPMAAYALRNGDLNVTNRDTSYTSDPYVLVQFYDSVAGEFRMAVYNIITTASNLSAGDLSYNYTFEQQMNAGEPVIPFYPLPQVIGATPSSSSYGKDGQPTVQMCYWKDHKGTAWAVSGNSFFFGYFFYPLLPDFWWPASDNKQPGDFVAFLPTVPRYAGSSFAGIDYTRNDQTPAAQGIKYTTVWPADVPILKVGETLTFPGGEYKLDHPTTTVLTDTGDFADEETPGLPGVVGFAAGQVVFDTMNPVMNDQVNFDSYTARIFPALEERTVSLPVNQFPSALLPANKRSTVKNGVYVFSQLPSSLQKRIFYDPIRAVIGIKGFLNDKDISDSTLTASPPAVYVLEPNVLTTAEKQALDGTASTSPFKDVAGTPFAAAMDALFNLSRNPNQLDKGNDGVDTAYRVGLEPKVKINPSTGKPLLTTNGTVITVQRDATKAAAMQALGPGLAMVANPNFLDPANPVQISYVTLAENNSDALGGSPVILHIVKVDKTQRYRGSIKTILSDNVFDENIVLRHTADFGGNADDLVFEWWYRPEDGTTALPPDRQPSPTPWKLFADPSGNLGQGFYQVTLKGNPSAPEVLLGDTLFFMRYRHKNELHNGVNWEVPQSNGERRCVLGDCNPGIPYDWAGAGNSSPEDLDGDGQPDYIAQLAEGWIKRVLTAVNPYEARINDFSQNAPATYSSIIQQVGAPYSGPVALNPDKNVIENVGLIALYMTILNRGEDLSINLSTPITSPTIANALQLASTRISDFYMLLGNEAYSDSLNPTIGSGSDQPGANLGTAVFAFENQVASRLDEELALLRGQNANNGTPVFNRLYWNFTHAEGEAAYAMKYNITDINQDGFIDVNDAMILYPQGHGDAWGHYLTAEKMQYDLLRHPYFNWVSRSEFINSQDVVIPVDYLDERKFAQIAAAKSQAGAAIVNMTYRQKYVADPRGQWQGYLDTDKNLSWGVDEWARRAGQGAYFDWITANALLPAVHPNTNYTGIQKIDRTTVTDISAISGNLLTIQTTMDQVDAGNNPLGLHNNALTFAVDPNFLIVGSGTQGQKFFQQIYAKAVDALNNAKATFDNASEFNNEIRQVANTEADFRDKVYEEDLAYRNQLIEIFGTPYAGTIGSGKLYPAGYQGPDLALFVYVKVNNVNDSTVPKPSLAYLNNLQDQTSGSSARLFEGGGIWIPLPSSWKDTFNLTLFNGTAASVNYTDFTPGTTQALPGNNQLQNLNLPVMADGYSYVAPTEWGQRSSVGQLQTTINQMVQAQTDLSREMLAWNAAQQNIIGKLRYLNSKFEWDADITALQLSQQIYDLASEYLSHSLKVAAQVSAVAADITDKAGYAVSSMIPTMTPEIGLSVSPGDALAPGRGGIQIGAVAGYLAGKGSATTLNSAGDIVKLVQLLADAGFDAGIKSYVTKEEWLNELTELQTYAKDESDQRLAVFKQVAVLNQLSDDYRTTLTKGAQLVQERMAYNKRVAAQTQQNRYQDITFRFARNAALEQYRSAFDLASRYAYLAATAYDYDLNLSLDDAGSPAEIMADIVRQRSIGLVADGVPEVGGQGLAEDLAKLYNNYNTLSTRMGLNNPQQETSTFSLRAERFRLLNDTNSDLDWQAKLLDPQIYKADLWQVPEFRHYCRAFAPESAGPQPGLVIPLSTKIVSGLNFFGWPLGGGDSAYDPSVYATRIVSVSVAFSGYDNSSLTRTPRVYLIPAGTDIMTVPNSPDQDVRLWNVVDQNIPLPYPATTANLGSQTWIPSVDSVTDGSGAFGDIRQFSSFRATGFDSVDPSDIDLSTLTYDTRLIGRSAWNTKWLLIIPGATLNSDPTTGLSNFINSVKDIKLIINSYGYSGN